MAPVPGIDFGDLAEAGWGVLFASDADPAIRDALKDLLDLRKAQATRKNERCYREYTLGEEYRLGESSSSFLAQQGMGPGPADPEKVPYYLLIVGDPVSIPFRFQELLDVNYAVGRIWFETVEEYAHYARGVVQAEWATLESHPRATFFAVRNPGDAHTQNAWDHLIDPVSSGIMSAVKERRLPSWATVEGLVGSSCTKERFGRLLGGDQTPRLLFATGHSMVFDSEDPRQAGHQGALLCQGWSGPGDPRGPISPELYFSADDLGFDAAPGGLIAVLLSSFSAGWSADDPAAQVTGRASVRTRGSLAALPQRLLGHSGGGALAVVGQVNRVLASGLPPSRNRNQVRAYTELLSRLMNGHPVGSALEPINELYAALAADLGVELDEIKRGRIADIAVVAAKWATLNDMRGWVVLGDPAVRLATATPVAETERTGPRASDVSERVPTTRWHLGVVPPPAAELMVGRVYPFELRLTPDERPGSVPIRVPASALELTFFLEAPGFRLGAGEPRRTLPVVGGVPRERSLTFLLVPLLGGPQTVRLLGYAGGQVEGLAPAELPLTVPVAAPVDLPDLPELVDQRKVPSPHPDVILYVSFEEQASGHRLSYYVTCPALGWLRRRLSPALEMAEGELERLREAVVGAAAEGPDAAPADTLARLQALGGALFNRLMPPRHELRTFLRQAVREAPPGAFSCLVISDERAILPWELVCPSVFLADVFMLSHWVGRQGLKLSAEAPLGRLDLTHYHQRPRDLDHWQSALGGEDVVVESRTGSLDLLEPSSSCYGLHVLRYAERGRPGEVASAEEAEARGGRGQAEAMIHDQRLDFALRRPVVGLSFVDDQPPDAWGSGSAADTRLEAGWILPLLRAGASALVGPRWPVHPAADRLFFQTFYEMIRGGETLGTATWRARQQVRQAFPTRADWLAYAYFGHPRCEPYKVRKSRGFALFEALGHPDGVPFRTGETVEFRASYRSRPPIWFEGQLRAAQPTGPAEDITVLVALLAAGEEPRTVPLVPVPGSDDCQGVVTVNMPEVETELPMVVRFQQGGEELQTLMLTLKIIKGRP